MLDRLDDADAEHFAEVRRLLDQSGIDYELDGTLVRGLDYYTRTVFEFESERLDAQAAGLGGGGRYDGLVEALGGPPTAGVGFAAGIERILMALDEPEPEPAADVFVAAPAEQAARAFALVRELRGAGLHAELDLAGRSIKGQMKQADRIGARARGDPRRGRWRRGARHGDRRAAPARPRTGGRRAQPLTRDGSPTRR